MDSPTVGSRPRGRTDESPNITNGLSDRVRSLRLPDRATQPRSTAKVAWFLVLILATSSAYLGYREILRSSSVSADAETAEQKVVTTESAPNVSATVQGDVSGRNSTATPQMGAIALESKGYLIPAHQILVGPKVSGMIVKSYLIEGTRVEKNDVLAELEKNDYEADYKRAKAALMMAAAKRELMLAGSRKEERDQVDAEVAEAERQLEQLKSDHQRNEVLRIKDRSLVPDSTFDQTKSLYEAALFRVKRLRYRREQIMNGNRKEEIAAAEAEYLQAEADVEKAAWRLSNCTIRAPISGTILKKNAEEGNIVNTIAPNGSFSLCDLADLSDLEVDLSIQERDISKVYPKQKCRIRSEAYPERLYEGVVDRLLPIADRAKGAIPVRVKVTVPKAEEGVYLKPDMSAVVTFLNDAAGR